MGSRKHLLVTLHVCSVTCQVTLPTQIGNELFLEFISLCYTVPRPVLGEAEPCLEDVI